MNKKWCLAFLAALPLLSGCVLIGNGGNGGEQASGNVTINWTFSGQGCDSLPPNAYVVITVPGQTLENGDGQPFGNNGQYSCLTDGYPGIELINFDPGNYTFTADAYDVNGTHLATGSGSFVIDTNEDNVTTSVDLTPIATGSIALAWTFPGSFDCTSAGFDGQAVANVNVTVDTGLPTTFACSAGNGGTSVNLTDLSVGAHTLTVTATDTNGDVFYTFSGSENADSTGTVQAIALAYAVGGTDVAWTLSDGVNPTTCDAAGTSVVWVNFQDTTTQQTLFAQNDLTQWPSFACSVGSATFDALPPGTYKVLMEASGNNGTVSAPAPLAPYYGQVAGSEPVVSIDGGTFPLTAQATVTLTPSP